MQKGLEHLTTDISEMKQNIKSKIIHLAFDRNISYKFMLMNQNRPRRKPQRMMNPPVMYHCERTNMT